MKRKNRRKVERRSNLDELFARVRRIELLIAFVLGVSGIEPATKLIGVFT